MPTFKSTAGDHPCEIFYEVRGEVEASHRGSEECSTSYSDRPDVVLIMGFAATHGCWEPQLQEGLLRPRHANTWPRSRVLLIDNRGVGRSGSPEHKHAYTTTIMAKDVLGLLDHLAWNRVHIVGHSMGSMIGAKIASLAPARICSLTLISPTGGGWQAIPRSLTAFWLCLQAVCSSSPETRAWVDVQLHFSRKMLNSIDDRYGRTRQELLHESYLEGSQGGGTGQPNFGFKGQLYAVWSHQMTDKEAAIIRHAEIPVMVIHGRHDIMAAPKYGEMLASRLEAPFIQLEGAHMLCRERGPEINLLLHHHIFHGRRLRDTQHKFLIDDPEDFPAIDQNNEGVVQQMNDSGKSSNTTSSGNSTPAQNNNFSPGSSQTLIPEA